MSKLTLLQGITQLFRNLKNYNVRLSTPVYTKFRENWSKGQNVEMVIRDTE